MSEETKKVWAETRKYLSTVAEALNKQIWLKVVLQAIPIIWSSVILQVFKSSLYDKETGNFTVWSTVIASILAVFSISVLILTGIKSKKDMEKKKELDVENTRYVNENALRSQIAISESSLEEQRNHLIIDYIEKKDKNKTVPLFFSVAFDAKKRINMVLEAIKECFSQVSSIEKNRIFISAAVGVQNTFSSKKAHEITWCWVVKPPSEGTMELNDLLKNENTMFRKVVDGVPFLYCNDKQQAVDKKKYVFDNLDATYDNNGSIICFEVADQILKYKIRMIVSISTYTKVYDGDDEDFIKSLYDDRIRAIIIEQFLEELKEDLALYFLQESFLGNESEHIEMKDYHFSSQRTRQLNPEQIPKPEGPIRSGTKEG